MMDLSRYGPMVMPDISYFVVAISLAALIFS